MKIYVFVGLPYNRWMEVNEALKLNGNSLSFIRGIRIIKNDTVLQVVEQLDGSTDFKLTLNSDIEFTI